MIGILVAVMIAVNGGLTTLYGMYSATVIIHIVGLILIVLFFFLHHHAGNCRRQDDRRYPDAARDGINQGDGTGFHPE